MDVSRINLKIKTGKLIILLKKSINFKDKLVKLIKHIIWKELHGWVKE